VATLYGFDLFLSDQPDTCAAINLTPQRATVLELRVAPQAGGAALASVVPPKATPGAGEAVGALVSSAAGVPLESHDAGDGSVSWTAAGSGDVTVDAVDVGFAGAVGRVAAAGLHLPACTR
jgi:hypothetical protein